MQIESDVTYLWVALGGAPARPRALPSRNGRVPLGLDVPLGDLAVNLTGSLAIGLVMTLLRVRADPTYRLSGTGFLGGYTTFSRSH